MKKFMKRILNDCVDIVCYSLLCIGFYQVMTNLCILNFFILMFGMFACEINNWRYLKNEFNKGYRHAAMLYILSPYILKHAVNDEKSFDIKLPRIDKELGDPKKLLNTTHEIENKCYIITDVVYNNDYIILHLIKS